MKKADIVKDGEIIDEINEGDRLLRYKSLEYLKDTQVWKIENFFKGNNDELRNWMNDLSVNEKALLFTISVYVGYEDCCIKYDNGNPLNFDDIVRLSCLSRGAVSLTLNTLIKKDILFRGKNSRERLYFINPWIYCKGNRINKVLKTMFRNYKIRVINKHWKDI